MSSTTQDDLPEIVMTIPGPWPDPEQFAKDLAGKGGYIFQGDRIMHVATRRMTPIGVQLHDDQLAKIFQLAGQNRIPRKNIAEIREHVCAITLRGLGGSVPAAREMMRLATALMKAGGMGVKIDSCGIAHGREDWFKLSDQDNRRDTGGLYWAFVVTVGNEREMYTCGMHQLGFRDSITSMTMDMKERYFQLNNFNGYIYQARPVLANGDKLGSDDEAVFSIWHETCAMFPPKTLYHNPYGMWRIKRINEVDAQS